MSSSQLVTAVTASSRESPESRWAVLASPKLAKKSRADVADDAVSRGCVSPEAHLWKYRHVARLPADRPIPAWSLLRLCRQFPQPGYAALVWTAARTELGFHSADEIRRPLSRDIGMQRFFGFSACLSGQSFKHGDTGNNNMSPPHLIGQRCDDRSVFR